jgi:hypothetical protein
MLSKVIKDNLAHNHMPDYFFELVEDKLIVRPIHAAIVTGHLAPLKPGTPTSVVMAGIPRPSGYYDYPFSDWEPMIPLTKTAYDLWINAGMLDYHHCIASGQKKTIECMPQSN